MQAVYVYIYIYIYIHILGAWGLRQKPAAGGIERVELEDVGIRLRVELATTSSLIF